jgi:hypothetical protein
MVQVDQCLVDFVGYVVELLRIPSTVHAHDGVFAETFGVLTIDG